MTSSSTSDAAADDGRDGPNPARLPRAARIRHGREIREVVRGGARVRARPFDVFVNPSDRGRPRIAVIVPRYGNTAVARNLVRRRLREALRTGWLSTAHAAGCGVDLVVRAKPAAYGASYATLRAALDRAVESACER